MGLPVRNASAVLAWTVLAGLGAGFGAGLAEANAHVQGSAARVHRLECFELRAAPDGPPLGYASLHRTEERGAIQLEWQVQFPGDEVNVWHVETRDARADRWVWRERNAVRARSVVAQRADDCLELLEWGALTPLRAALAAPASCAFPLELEERLRDGEDPGASVAVFDPLSNRLETLLIAATETAVGDGGTLRRFELLRADGTLFSSWTFLGRELASFAWQRGGLVAVRVDAERVAQPTIATGFANSRTAVPPTR